MAFIALVPSIYTNVKQYGALGDGKTVTDGAITSGLAVLTSATAAFTAADVGKQVTVNGAGAAAANLNTTISAYTNATTVRLTANAGTTVTSATVFYGTDDTAAIAAALSAANSAGGGTVLFPAGTYISGNQTLYANVSLVGAGLGATIIKLKAGANTDLLSAQTSSINLAAVADTNIVGTLLSFTLRDMRLDGNRDNQTAGPSYPLRFYGYNFVLRDLEIMQGYTGGLLIDWNGGTGITSPSDNMESTLENIKLHENNGVGLQMGGPHDSHINNTLSWNNGSHNFHLTPNMVGTLVVNSHGYHPPNTTGVCCWLVEAGGCQFTNCMAEGSYYCQVAMIASQCSWLGGIIFAPVPATMPAVTGIQLGQLAGQTPFAGQILQSAGVTTALAADFCVINTQINECRGGALDCQSEGNNVIIANVFQTVGTALVGNNINRNTDSFLIRVVGLTSDNTLGKSGGLNVAVNASSHAFTVSDQTNGQTFQVDQYGNVYLSGGLNLSAGLYFTATTAGVALTTGGTITLQGTPDIAVTPTADVTGVILQAGYPGQFSVVLNVSAFTITMAASGTSNVANGVLCKIVANQACAFFYDSTNSLWYPCALTPLPTQSATAVAITAGAATIATTDLDVSRISPTAARATAILQAGVYPGQRITVINEAVAASTLTFDVAGTSHVADGASSVIAGLTAQTYVWDSGTSLWYHTK